MGTLGCINDMLQRDKMNRDLRKRNRERLAETRNRMLETGLKVDYDNLKPEKIEEIIQNTKAKEKADAAYLVKIYLCCTAGLALVLLLTWLLMGCSSTPIGTHRENGWYRVMSGKPDSLSVEPIVSAKEFSALRLDSDVYGRYIIFGQIHPMHARRWADETEKAIGKQLAFVFNDSIISNPTVNMRIESGNFAITSHNDKMLPFIFEKLRSEMNPGSTGQQQPPVIPENK